MKPEQHFEQQKRLADRDGSSIADRNANTLRAILADKDALGELDHGYEVWLDVDLESLSQLLVALLHHDQRQGRNSDIDRIRIRHTISYLVEDAWHGAINGLIADLHELEQSIPMEEG